MQIVIDIPDEMYRRIALAPRCATGLDAYRDRDAFVKAIQNGTPLPKGHGRLIDADEIISEATERMKYPANHKYMECVIAHMNLAPTIIEADKAESEK